MTAELPHQSPGTTVALTVRVTADGKPAPGVTVFWEDWHLPRNLVPAQSTTNALGVATTTWRLPALVDGQYRARASAQAAVPGANGNPIRFGIEVIQCSRC
ncbi:MAG TPA: hypothetical protein PKA50_18770 [Gemmatimonadales bacterium]|nr:hypothetical protein [Gemmatimonadales bacterium]